MSYEILYNKQFLRTREGYIIPIVLMGSNNCTEVQYNGRERRSRDWSILSGDNGKIEFTPEEFLGKQEKYLDCEEFIYSGCKFITGKQWHNIVKKAVRDAVTVEELQQYERPIAHMSIWKDMHNSHTPRTPINTSEDLENVIADYYNRLTNRENGETIYLIIDFRVEKFAHQKQDKRTASKPRLTNFYVISFDKGFGKQYVSKVTARNLGYMEKPEYAKQFKTEQEAQKWIAARRIDQRFRTQCNVERGTAV